MRRADVMLDALASTPADVARAVRRLDARHAAARPAADEWAVVDILAHLSDVEDRCRDRFSRVLESDDPVLVAIRPTASGHPPEGTCAELADRFAGARGDTLALLRDVPRGGWARTAVHPTLGPTRLLTLVQHLVEHDVAHLAQLVETRNRTAIPEGDVA